MFTHAEASFKPIVINNGLRATNGDDTMIKLTSALRAQLIEAKKTLVTNGWEQSHSVMHDGGATDNFGICFRKDGASFYLNFLTINQLPN